MDSLNDSVGPRRLGTLQLPYVLELAHGLDQIVVDLSGLFVRRDKHLQEYRLPFAEHEGRNAEGPVLFDRFGVAFPQKPKQIGVVLVYRSFVSLGVLPIFQIALRLTFCQAADSASLLPLLRGQQLRVLRAPEGSAETNDSSADSPRSNPRLAFTATTSRPVNHVSRSA